MTTTTRPSGVPAATSELKSAIAGAVDKSTGPEVSKAKAESVAAVAVAEIKADPVAMNALNQEPLVQSGVVWGGSAGLLSAIAAILLQVADHGDNYAAYELEVVGPSVMMLGSAAFTLYRRITPGLKPLFWRFTRRR